MEATSEANGWGISTTKAVNWLCLTSIEIKNCHLSRGAGLAEFPDCVAARSSKHLRELAAMIEAGDRAVVLFVIQREDCDRFAACHELDPEFAAGLDRAATAGVEVLAYQCSISTKAVRLSGRIPWTSAVQARHR